MPGRAFARAAGPCVERGVALGRSPEGLATAREVVRKSVAASCSGGDDGAARRHAPPTSEYANQGQGDPATGRLEQFADQVER